MVDDFVNTVPQAVKKILVVGLTNIDVINICDHFPIEDEDMRVISQRWSPGGNAANTSRVLSQHKNVEVHLFSGLSSKIENSFVIKELKKSRVNVKLCSFYDEFNFPMASCIINSQNGSRTILSCSQNFPKLDSKAFMEKVDVNVYDLIHFEGRDLDEVNKMIDYVIENRKSKSKPIISGEMEKPKRLIGLEKYIQPKVDLLFINKDIAKGKGYKNAMETVKAISATLPLNANYIVCPWGAEDSAFAELSVCENVWRFTTIPIDKLEKPVDTLGAGDTFIAGVIYGFLATGVIEKAVHYGCYIAKKKCEIVGFENLIPF